MNFIVITVFVMKSLHEFFSVMGLPHLTVHFYNIRIYIFYIMLKKNFILSIFSNITICNPFPLQPLCHTDYIYYVSITILLSIIFFGQDILCYTGCMYCVSIAVLLCIIFFAWTPCVILVIRLEQYFTGR